jgi:hypothetical protein
LRIVRTNSYLKTPALNDIFLLFRGISFVLICFGLFLLWDSKPILGKGVGGLLILIGLLFIAILY